jgi:hypothetical protein
VFTFSRLNFFGNNYFFVEQQLAGEVDGDTVRLVLPDFDPSAESFVLHRVQVTTTCGTTTGTRRILLRGGNLPGDNAARVAACADVTLPSDPAAVFEGEVTFDAPNTLRAAAFTDGEDRIDIPALAGNQTVAWQAPESGGWFFRVSTAQFLSAHVFLRIGCEGDAIDARFAIEPVVFGPVFLDEGEVVYISAGPVFGGSLPWRVEVEFLDAPVRPGEPETP